MDQKTILLVQTSQVHVGGSSCWWMMMLADDDSRFPGGWGGGVVGSGYVAFPLVDHDDAGG